MIGVLKNVREGLNQDRKTAVWIIFSVEMEESKVSRLFTIYICDNSWAEKREAAFTAKCTKNISVL